MRGNADVEQNTVHGGNIECGKHLVHLGEIRLHHGGGKPRKRRACRLDGVGVAIEGDEPAVRETRGDGFAVPAAARRAVKIDPFWVDLQRVNGLFQENGNVIGRVRHDASSQKPRLANSSSMFSGESVSISAS